MLIKLYDLLTQKKEMMKKLMIFIVATVLLSACTKDEAAEFHQLLGLEGTVTVYHTISGVPARNATVVVSLNGMNMTSGYTNQNGRVDLNVAHIVSGRSTSSFPERVTIFAQDRDDPSIKAEGTVKVRYRQTGSDGSTKQYKGDFSVNVIIKK